MTSDIDSLTELVQATDGVMGDRERPADERPEHADIRMEHAQSACAVKEPFDAAAEGTGYRLSLRPDRELALAVEER